MGSIVGGALKDLTGGVTAAMMFAIAPYVVAFLLALTLPLVVLPKRAANKNAELAAPQNLQQSEAQ